MKRLVNIKKFCDTKPHRLWQGVILHDTTKEVSVATNGHYMLISKAHYKQMMVCDMMIDFSKKREFPCEVVYTKEPTINQNNYPNYRLVIPEVSDRHIIQWKPSEIGKAAKICYEEKLQLEGKKKTAEKIAIFKVGLACLNYKTACLLAAMPDDGVIYVKNETTAIVYENEDYKALFMPVLGCDDTKFIEQLLNNY